MSLFQFEYLPLHQCETYLFRPAARVLQDASKHPSSDTPSYFCGFVNPRFGCYFLKTLITKISVLANQYEADAYVEDRQRNVRCLKYLISKTLILQEGNYLVEVAVQLLGTAVETVRQSLAKTTSPHHLECQETFFAMLKLILMNQVPANTLIKVYQGPVMLMVVSTTCNRPVAENGCAPITLTVFRSRMPRTIQPPLVLGCLEETPGYVKGKVGFEKHNLDQVIKTWSMTFKLAPNQTNEYLKATERYVHCRGAQRLQNSITTDPAYTPLLPSPYYLGKSSKYGPDVPGRSITYYSGIAEDDSPSASGSEDQPPPPHPTKDDKGPEVIEVRISSSESDDSAGQPDESKEDNEEPTQLTRKELKIAKILQTLFRNKRKRKVLRQVLENYDDTTDEEPESEAEPSLPREVSITRRVVEVEDRATTPPTEEESPAHQDLCTYLDTVIAHTNFLPTNPSPTPGSESEVEVEIELPVRDRLLLSPSLLQEEEPIPPTLPTRPRPVDKGLHHGETPLNRTWVPKAPVQAPEALVEPREVGENKERSETRGGGADDSSTEQVINPNSRTVCFREEGVATPGKVRSLSRSEMSPTLPFNSLYNRERERERAESPGREERARTPRGDRSKSRSRNIPDSPRRQGTPSRGEREKTPRGYRSKSQSQNLPDSPRRYGTPSRGEREKTPRGTGSTSWRDLESDTKRPRRGDWETSSRRDHYLSPRAGSDPDPRDFDKRNDDPRNRTSGRRPRHRRNREKRNYYDEGWGSGAGPIAEYSPLAHLVRSRENHVGAATSGAGPNSGFAGASAADVSNMLSFMKMFQQFQQKTSTDM